MRYRATNKEVYSSLQPVIVNIFATNNAPVFVL